MTQQIVSLAVEAAIDIVEGSTDATNEERVAAFQALVDSGIVWEMSGEYRKTAAFLIRRGLVQDAKRDRKIH